MPIVCEDRIIASIHTSKSDCIKSLDPAAKVLWMQEMDPWSVCAARAFLLVTTERRWLSTAHLLDLMTGAEQTSGRAYHVEVLLPDEQHYVGSYTRRKERRNSVGLFALPSFAEIWHRDAEEFSPTYNFEGGVAAADGRVFVGTGPGLGEGDGLLIALSEESGEKLWSVDLKEMGGPVQGGKWNPMVSQGLLVINTAGGTVAFDATTGRLAWKAHRAGGRGIYDGRVYVTASGWYSVLDLENGHVLLDREISQAMKKTCPLVFSRLATQINVSETHVFAGDADGGLWAWDRETGDVVWHDHPKGADGFIGVLPVIAGRRLYVGSTGFGDRPSYLYCYEEDHGTGGEEREAAAAGKAAAQRKRTTKQPKEKGKGHR